MFRSEEYLVVTESIGTRSEVPTNIHDRNYLWNHKKCLDNIQQCLKRTFFLPSDLLQYLFLEINHDVKKISPCTLTDFPQDWRTKYDRWWQLDWIASGDLGLAALQVDPQNVPFHSQSICSHAWDYNWSQISSEDWLQRRRQSRNIKQKMDCPSSVYISGAVNLTFSFPVYINDSLHRTVNNA